MSEARAGGAGTEPLNVAIIGLGGVAAAHLSALAGLDSVRIRSVCDIDARRAQRVARDLAALAFDDPADLLSAGGVDLVMVLTPAATHRAVVEAVAEAGIHVFCEKPLAVTLEDGEAMVRACDDAGVRFFYGSSYRFLPAVRKAHALIASGAIGRIRLMSEHLVGGRGLDGYRQLGPAHYPKGGPGGAGMGLVDHGVHMVDVFSWFAGSPPQRATGHGQVSGADPVPEFLHMEFPCGARGHLLYDAATWSAALPNEGMFSGGQGWLADGSVSAAGLWESEPGSISVHGTQGALRVFHYANALFLSDCDGIRRVELDGRPAFGHFATQLEACMTAIRNRSAPPVGGKEALQALRVLLSAYPDTPG